jgi:hypothetical protein
MRLAALALLLAIAAMPVEPDPKHFAFYADVQTGAPETQDYIAVTHDVWSRARADLGDLRLYADAEQIPYVLLPSGAYEGENASRSAQVLNKGRVNGRTQVDLELPRGDALVAIDAVQLKLKDSAPDFMATAHLEGYNLGEPHVDLGDFTLFKLEKQDLGANLTLRLRPVSFQYLRVSVASIDPNDIVSAAVTSPAANEYGWTEVTLATELKQEKNKTVLRFNWPESVPLSRIVIQASGPRSFWRKVEITNAEGAPVAHGAIWSVEPRTSKVLGRSQNAEILFGGEQHSKSFEVVIANGDDPPLTIASATASYHERRLYFDPHSHSALRLYLGDKDLERPTYDYAKTAIPSPDAARATLAAVIANPQLTARPDTRPWTEQHPAVLWVALGIAVLGLGAIALRGLKTA